MYLSGRMVGAMCRALMASWSLMPSWVAVVGAPICLSVFLICFQFVWWRYAARIVPTPHCSPCRAWGWLMMSRAWLKRCSAPLQGRLLPAMLMATPQLMRASRSVRRPSLLCGWMCLAFWVTSVALMSARLAAYSP